MSHDPSLVSSADSHRTLRAVDVRIGVTQAPRELNIELPDDTDRAELKAKVEAALAGATDVSHLEGHAALAAAAVTKKLFLDVVKELTKAPADGGLGLTKTQIPAKLEGIAFGEDVVVGDSMKHTLFIANDNDFLSTFDGQLNPNRFYVFAFDAGDLQAAFGDAAHAALALEPQVFEKK